MNRILVVCCVSKFTLSSRNIFTIWPTAFLYNLFAPFETIKVGEHCSINHSFGEDLREVSVRHSAYVDPHDCHGPMMGLQDCARTDGRDTAVDCLLGFFHVLVSAISGVTQNLGMPAIKCLT